MLMFFHIILRYNADAKTLIDECLNIECGFICYEQEEEYSFKVWKVIY